MFRKALNFIKHPTSRDIIINTIGNNLNIVFTAFFYFLLVRILDKPHMGVLSVLLGIAYVLANILDFGTTAAIYSYLPPLLEKKATNLYRFIKSTFFYQTLLSTIVIVILVFTFPYLDKVFFKTNAPTWELYLTLLSILFFIWQNFVTNILFAAKKFLKTNLYINIANVIKTLIILVLVVTDNVSVGAIIFDFGILGPSIFFFLLFLDKKDMIFVLMKSDVKREELRFGYTISYLIGTQFFNLGTRMDLFLLSYFRTQSEVGEYGVAQKIILTVLTTLISVTQVLSPSFSKIQNKKEIIRALKTGILYLLLPLSLFALLLILPDWVFTLFFRKEFNRTADITRLLSIPFIIYTLTSIPLLFLLYTVKKPSYILVANIVFFLVTTIGCYWLIPDHGVYGPPLALNIAFIISGIMLFLSMLYEYQRIPG